MRYGEGKIHAPAALSVASNGDIAVVDIQSDKIWILNSGGEILKEYPYSFGKNKNNFQGYDIGFDQQGRIYLLDGQVKRVCIFDRKSDQRNSYPVRIFSPLVQMAVRPDGVFSVLSIKTTQISFYSSKGRHLAKLDNGPDKNSHPRFGKPCMVLMDTNDIWIADAWKFEILQVRFTDKVL